MICHRTRLSSFRSLTSTLVLSSHTSTIVSQLLTIYTGLHQPSVSAMHDVVKFGVGIMSIAYGLVSYCFFFHLRFYTFRIDITLIRLGIAIATKNRFFFILRRPLFFLLILHGFDRSKMLHALIALNTKAGVRHAWINDKDPNHFVVAAGRVVELKLLGRY